MPDNVNLGPVQISQDAMTLYQEFRKSYEDAFNQWARKENASGDGGNNIVDEWNKNPRYREGVINGAFQRFMQDPSSFAVRAGEGSIGDIPQKLIQFMDPGFLGKWAKSPEQQARESQNAGNSQDPAALMEQFAKSMMGPLDQNDPYVQRLSTLAANQAGDQARLRGIGGGYAVGNTEANVVNALTDLQTQRQGIGLQALQGAAGLNLQQAQMAQAAYDKQYQAQMAQLQNSYSQGQGTAQTIGAIGGGVLGAVGTYFTGNPALIPAGASLGAGVGGGIYSGTRSQPYMPYNPPGMGRNPYRPGNY